MLEIDNKRIFLKIEALDYNCVELWETVIEVPKYMVPRIGETISIFNKKLNKYVDIEVKDIIYKVCKNNNIDDVIIKGTCDLETMPF